MEELRDHHVRHTHRRVIGGITVQIVTTEPFLQDKHFFGATSEVAVGNGNPQLFGRERVTFTSIDKALEFFKAAVEALEAVKEMES